MLRRWCVCLLVLFSSVAYADAKPYWAKDAPKSLSTRLPVTTATLDQALVVTQFHGNLVNQAPQP